MGEVYLCLDLEEMLPLALKTFQPRYQSSALRKAFEQEVGTWVALEKHPNIVRCFDMTILDNRPFMRLEWIAGEEGKGADLRGWLRHGPLDLRTALEIIIDVVRGLIYAQEKQPGLVHRDLKPENILVAQGQVAKITDFGLAQIVEIAGLEVDVVGPPAPPQGGAESEIPPSGGLGGSLIRQGGIAGTPAYMAPEQWRGEPLDERTDIYAMGCILYELLTGRWPYRVAFSPTTPPQWQQWLSAMQAQHETEPLAPLSPEVPGPVSDLLQQCLAKQPAARPPGLVALVDRLEALYEAQFNQPPPARPQAAVFNAGDYTNRGLTYAALQRYEAALADYGRALDLDPTDAPVYANRGNTYQALQRYDEALADYGRALDLDPTLAPAYYNRGTTYHALQRYEAALADYGRALDLDPTDAQAYFNLGVLLANTGSLRESLPYFEQAARLNLPQANQAIAQIRQALGESAPEPPVDPVQAAFAAFQRAASPQAMGQAVAHYPFMTQADFIAAIEQFIAQQVPPQDRPYFAERLTWLRQIAEEQG
jgi:serine/threonine protein kinase